MHYCSRVTKGTRILTQTFIQLLDDVEEADKKVFNFRGLKLVVANDTSGACKWQRLRPSMAFVHEATLSSEAFVSMGIAVPHRCLQVLSRGA